MAGKKKLRERLGTRTSTRQMYATQRSTQPVDLGVLRLDGGTQPRSAFDEAIVSEYASRMRVDDRGIVVDPQGAEWEAVVVYDDDDSLWLADGFHRVRAARAQGVTHFQARILPGEQRDAVRYSLSANATHGVRRTSHDKRRAVRRALEDGEWGALSARALAEMCAVSDFLVRQVRQELEGDGALEPQSIRVGADGEVHDVSTRLTRAPSKGTSSGGRRGVTLTSIATVETGEEMERVRFDSLDGAADIRTSSCIVATPETIVHFDVLVDHLPRLLEDRGALIVGVSHGVETLEGLARLSALVEKGTLAPPQWVIFTSEKRIAITWIHNEHPSSFSSLHDLVSSLVTPRTLLITPNI